MAAVHSPLYRRDPLSPLSPMRQNSIMSGKRQSFLGSIKDKVSRRNSNPKSPSTSSSTPFTAAPHTRRPNQSHANPFASMGNSDTPPPPYTANAPSSSVVSSNLTTQPQAARPSTSRSNASRISATSTPDDPYAFLRTFDTVFVIDDSGSMAGRSWRECQSALESIAPICASHDADGIDIYFLNAPDSTHYKNVKLSSTIQEIFSSVRPSGTTPTGQKLNRIIKLYLNNLVAAGVDSETVKPLNIIVITDGVPSDDVESVLVNAAKKLDKVEAEPWQLGVQFVQVGKEPGAKEHLESLDDDLAKLGGGCRDIVDTVPYAPGVQLSGDMVLKVVLGAVNKRIDRLSNV